MPTTPKKSFRISGRVMDRQTRRGVPRIRVEAWDKDLICDHLVGSAVTDEEGRFSITFDESYFRELFADREPDLFFKVYRGDELIASTEDSVLWNVSRKKPREIVIEADLRAKPPVQAAVHVNKPELLNLLTLKDVPARDLKTREPALWESLLAQGRARARERLLAAVETAPADVRDHVARLDLSGVAPARVVMHARESVLKSSLPPDGKRVAIERLARAAPALPTLGVDENQPRARSRARSAVSFDPSNDDARTLLQKLLRGGTR